MIEWQPRFEWWEWALYLASFALCALVFWLVMS